MFKHKTFLLAVLFLFTEFTSAQCAMCKAVVESGDAEMAEGLNDGIVYLMVFPYLLLGVVGYLIYRARKKGLKKSD